MFEVRCIGSGFSATCKNCCEFVSFLEQKRRLVLGNEFAVSNELEPIQALVRFFYRNSEFACEFCSWSRPACAAIVCANRSSCTNELARNRATGSRAQGKLFSSILQLTFVH